MAQKVIDVSEHNGKIDWQAVKNAGYHAIIRCGYGSDYRNQDDKQWQRNVSECERLGIPYGVYLYSYAKNTDMARSEAKHVLRLINGRNLSYPVYFDTEEDGTQGVSKANAIAFGDVIEAAGYWCGVYASASWWKSNLAGLERFTKWVAHWGATSPVVKCDLWQYTSDGSVSGVGGRVDMNTCYRDFPSEIGGTQTGGGTRGESTAELAQRVINGEFGNGEARRTALGSRYDEVQAEVNRILGAVDIDDLARRTINGEFGNGEARRKALGSNYDAVQKRVNQMLR